VEAQVDWYEAVADLAGNRTKLQVFSMRSMASGAAFHCAFLHAWSTPSWSAAAFSVIPKVFGRYLKKLYDLRAFFQTNRRSPAS
jgi:hypothetical protein